MEGREEKGNPGEKEKKKKKTRRTQRKHSTVMDPRRETIGL